MTSVFHKILRAVAGAMEIPDVVFLVLALGFAVFSVGWLICEYFTEHRHMREDLPRLLDALREQGADTAALIRKSQLNRRQKAALLELTETLISAAGCAKVWPRTCWSGSRATMTIS